MKLIWLARGYWGAKYWAATAPRSTVSHHWSNEQVYFYNENSFLGGVVAPAGQTGLEWRQILTIIPLCCNSQHQPAIVTHSGPTHSNTSISLVRPALLVSLHQPPTSSYTILPICLDFSFIREVDGKCTIVVLGPKSQVTKR